MHVGRNQPMYMYSYHLGLQGTQLVSVDTFTNLGITLSNTPGHRYYIDDLPIKACMTAVMLSRALQTFSRQLLWPAFQLYFLRLCIAAPAWCPIYKLTLITIL